YNDASSIITTLEKKAKSNQTKPKQSKCQLHKTPDSPIMENHLTPNSYSIIRLLESNSFSWMFIPDHRHPCRATLSWLTFSLLTFVVPVLSHYSLLRPVFHHDHLRPFDWIVQVSLSSFSTLSFVCLWRFTSKYGLTRFLFLDKLDSVGGNVRPRYSDEVQLTCSLQILRLEDFAHVFEKLTDVGPILVQHLTIKRNLRVISHRFRAFILLTLILLCSITLVFGLYICQRSAAKITHKAQSLTSLVTKWHMCATADTFADMARDEITPQVVDLHSENEVGDGEDELDNTNFIPVYKHTISYQQRQALVTYFENNETGITVYGFMLDRSSINTVFAIQLSLALWLFDKTIGFV
ncbi:hypothetical protein M8C21_018634, partial [Ambrosia artemisiifolia]